jgi:hypothetical protein
MSTANLLDLKVPSVGESVSEVEVGDWLKAEGAKVARDENIVVLETDKATMEVPAPAAGRLTKILKQKGERVRVGDVLGQLEPDGDGASENRKSAAADTKPERADAPPTEQSGAQSEAWVMPAAARVMAEKKVAPDQVTPSGPGGRMLKEDVERAAGSSAATSAHSDIQWMRVALLFPIAMSIGFALLFGYGAIQARVTREELFKIRNNLHLYSAPEYMVLMVFLWISAALMILVSLALGILAFYIQVPTVATIPK